MFSRRKLFFASLTLVLFVSLAIGFGRILADDPASSEPQPVVQNDSVQTGEVDPEVAQLQEGEIGVETAVDSEGNPSAILHAPGLTDTVEETLTPEEMRAPTITYFKRYPGMAFQPRDSDTGYDYFGNGCISSKVADSFVLDIQLPTGAEIDFVRMYFYDASSANSRMFLAWYDGQGGYSDVMFIDSSGNSGYGSVGDYTSYIIDPVNQAISLVWQPNTTGSSMALCGVRIRYQVPASSLHLPVVLNNSSGE